jgi:hypothetical protein
MDFTGLAHGKINVTQHVFKQFRLVTISTRLLYMPSSSIGVSLHPFSIVPEQFEHELQRHVIRQLTHGCPAEECLSEFFLATNQMIVKLAERLMNELETVGEPTVRDYLIEMHKGAAEQVILHSTKVRPALLPIILDPCRWEPAS